MEKRHKDVFQESRKLIISYAIFRWENAVIIGGAILLTAFYRRPFPWWPSFGWILLGLLGVAGVFYSSLTNTKLNARLVLEGFQEQFDLSDINKETLREDLKMALAYQSRIEEVLLQESDNPLLGRAQDTARDIRRWVYQIYELSLHVDKYQKDTLVKRELKDLPAEIDNLEAKKTKENNPEVVKEYETLLKSKRNHLETLNQLDNRMKKANLQLENSLAALATVDSQVSLLTLTDIDGARAKNLRADIQEQVNQLGDLIESIQEVYTK